MTFIRPEEVLEIMFRIPNLEPFFFIDSDYEELVDMYTYKEFPITKDEFENVKEYLTEHYGAQLEAWKAEPEEEYEDEEEVFNAVPQEPVNTVYENKNSNAFVRKLNHVVKVTKDNPYNVEIQRQVERKMLGEAYRILNENVDGSGLAVSLHIKHTTQPSITDYTYNAENLVSTLSMSPGYMEILPEPISYVDYGEVHNGFFDKLKLAFSNKTVYTKDTD